VAVQTIVRIRNALEIVSTGRGVDRTVVDSNGIGVDLLSKIQIDPVNDFVFVMEAVTNGKIYREALAGPASGSCPTGGSGGGGGSSSSSGSGSSSGAVDYILLSMLAGLTISRGLLRFRRRKKR